MWISGATFKLWQFGIGRVSSVNAVPYEYLAARAPDGRNDLFALIADRELCVGVEVGNAHGIEVRILNRETRPDDLAGIIAERVPTVLSQPAIREPWPRGQQCHRNLWLECGHHQFAPKRDDCCYQRSDRDGPTHGEKSIHANSLHRGAHPVLSL